MATPLRAFCRAGTITNRAFAIGSNPGGRRDVTAARTAVAMALAVGAALGTVSPVAAGGSHLSPVDDRYDPGETATLVGDSNGAQLDGDHAPQCSCNHARCMVCRATPATRTVDLVGRLPPRSPGDPGWSRGPL